jgi:hypothetical protein
MWKWAVWIVLPIVCMIVDPDPKGRFAQPTLIDFVMFGWMLWTAFIVFRGVYRWFFRTAGKAWYSQAPRN